MKKSFILFFLFLIITACGGGNQNLWEGPDTLVLRLMKNPDTLNPVSAVDAYATRVNQFCFDSLVDIDSDLNVIPSIAKNWTWETNVQADKTDYILTFYLRDDVYWHDGVKFTAHDMVYTYECIMTPESKAFNKIASFEGLVDNVVALNDYTLEVTYNQVIASAVLSWGTTPLPKHIYEQYDTWEEFHNSPYNRTPIGNGPYKVVEWKTAQYIVMEKVTNYWREEPQFDTIVYKIISDNNIALSAFRRGDFDLFQLISEQYNSEKDEDYYKEDYTNYQFPTFGFSQIAWNCGEDSIFNDKNVRTAMTYALDRQTIADTVLYGLSVPISGPFILNSWAYNSDVEPIPFDLEKAKSLLTESGWSDSDDDGILDKDGKKLEFEVVYGSDSPTGKAVVLNLQENLAKIGGVVNGLAIEWSAFSQRLEEHNFDGALFAWSLGSDMDIYDLFHSTQTNGINYGDYVNQEVDVLLEAGRGELDQDKRALIYQESHKLINEDQPYTFLFCSLANYGGAKSLKGVEIGQPGLTDWYPSFHNWYEEEAE